MDGLELESNVKKEERSSSLRTEDLTPKLLTKLREESLHSTSPKEALMSAISASFQDLSQLGENEGDGNDEEGLGLAPELVVEVNCVLSKLMNSLNENLDPELIPTIKDLQATLNSKKKRVELESRFRRQCPPQDSSASKVPWKIRAARKRAIKHHTTGMTKDEFQLIKNSLQESAKSFTSIPTQSYALSRNKSESAIRSHRNEIAGNLNSEPFHSQLKSVIKKHDEKTRTLPLVTNGGGSDLKPSDLGYASDVCDYNISSSSASEKVSKSTPSSNESKTLQTKENMPKNSEKPPRRTTKSHSGSAIKARIDRRKRMRHANAIDNPHGSLSDQESSMIEDNDDEEEDEQHQSAAVSSDPKRMIGSNEDENNNENKSGDSDVKNLTTTNYNSSSSELTPETARRKNWNSRFSNIKNAFASEEEIFYKSRSPSINRESNNNNNSVNGASQGKKADDKYMNIVVQARLENNRSRKNLNASSNSKNTGSNVTKQSVNGNSSSSSSTTTTGSGQSNKISSSKSKQPTPNRDPQPKSPPRLSKSLPKESRAEAMGLEPANKNRNDMDYAEYMNIISRVRRTKESTRVRTEQFRLASMYAQEKRRQEEIKREEERLKLEREKVQKDLERQKIESQATQVPKEVSKSDSVPSPVQKVTTTTSTTTPKEESIVSVSESSVPEEGTKECSSLSPEATNDKTVARLEEQARLERMRQEQKRQQELREEQVKAEQEKLERLRQEQIRQEKEREEIHRLEYERLKQIQEEQRKLDEERRRQQERIRQEQVRLEEERKRQGTLQAERNAEYNRQRLDMEAQNVCLPQETRAKLLVSPTASSALPVSLASSTPNSNFNFDQLSPEEKIVRRRLADQESLRKSHKAEESKIRQEKLKLIQQEEMLISRQEEMLRQVEAERQNLLKQEQLIRSRQQGRLTQVRQEKMLLEKQEEMLQMRERQLIEERIRQEKLRMEQKSLREQEEVIRKRQEQISKELMGDLPMMVFSSNESTVQVEGEEDEDTLDDDSDGEEFYESTVEVKQKATSVPTSVRTVGLANTDDKPWAPITPYLSTYESSRSGNNNTTPPAEMFMDDDKPLFKSGIITSPESLRTSSTLITTPDESSLQLSLDGGSSINTPPSVPPLPFDEVFRPVQPEVPPRVSSYDIVAASSLPSMIQPEPPRRSLIDTTSVGPNKKTSVDPFKQSPKIGGPGSAFKPYSSSENLHDPSLFPPQVVAAPAESSTNLLLPPTYPSVVPPKKQHPVVYNKVKELRKPIRAPFSTTDTEPEMKECHFPPEKNKRTVIKQHPYKPSYSTSETEDEAYLSRRTKWSRHQSHHHQKHSGSWDPFAIESPPQITQKPVGIIQKPKPQHTYHPSTITLGAVEAPIPAATVSESLYPPLVIERGAQITNLLSMSTKPLNQNSSKPDYTTPPSSNSLIGSPPRGTTLLPPPPSMASVPPASIQQLTPQNSAQQMTSQNSFQPPKPTVDTNHPSLWNQIQSNNAYPPPPQALTSPPAPPPPPPPVTTTINKDEDKKTVGIPFQPECPTQKPLMLSQNAKNEVAVDINKNHMFEPSKVLRQSSFSSLPVTTSIHENVPRQSSYNCVPSIEGRSENDRKLSSVVRTEPDTSDSSTVINSPIKKTTKLQEELEKKLEERKVSKEERLRKQSKEEANALVPLTVVEMSSAKKNTPAEDQTLDQEAQRTKTLRQRLADEVVSFKKDFDGKKKSSLPRNNATITAMEIMTRKEIRTCELEEQLLREKYGQTLEESSDSRKSIPLSKLNSPNKPASSTSKPTGTQQNGVNSNANSNKPPPPKIILKKEPKRLDPEEIKARKSSTEKQQPQQPPMEPKKEARVISASNVITRSNNGVVEKKKEEYIENLSKSSSVEDMDDSRAAKIKREKVKKAAERFEKTASPVVGSKSNLGPGDKLPWNDETTPSLGKPKPGILRRRETFGGNGYALRMSKSSDSITASRMMSNNSSGLRINQYNNPGSDSSSSDVYHKTRDEIRKILTIAKQSSVTERIKIFNNQIMGEVRPIDEEDRDRKAEAIKKEILAAKMSAVEDDDDEPGRTTLQIPKKNPSSECRLRINQPPGSNASGQKMGRKLSGPALNGSVKSRIESYMGVKSSNKKEPKLIMNSQTHQICAQSATDYSATEEETDFRGAHGQSSMDYLQVPNAASSKKRGLRRSKSFASSGQYECVLGDDEIDEKTRQVMAFFNTTPSHSSSPQQQIRVVSSESAKPLKGVLKTRQQSISDEIIGDEDLGNVDDIFERLLVENSIGDEGEAFEKSTTYSSSRSTTRTALVRSASGGNSDPLSALPPTHNKRHHYHHHGHHGHHQSSSSRNHSSWGARGSHEYQSSSPTQSECGSCDPWEDY